VTRRFAAARTLRRRTLATLAGAATAGAAAQAPVEPLPAVEVIAPAPLPGLGIPLNAFPGNVQTFGRRDLERRADDDVARFLGRNAIGVALENAQGNPFQQDLLFRGFPTRAVTRTTRMRAGASPATSSGRSTSASGSRRV